MTALQENSAVESTPKSRQQRLSDLVYGLARDIDRAADAQAAGPPGVLDRGGVAELRRLDPRQEASGSNLTFWRLFARTIEPALGPGATRDLSIRHWMAILRGMASHAGLNLGGRRAGFALRDAGVSEARLTKLLRATGDPLFDDVRAVARLAYAQGFRLDWTDLAELVLTEGQPRGEAVRRRLALDYYRPAKTSSDDSSSPGGSPS